MEMKCCSAGAIDTVATTGKFDIGPNTMNSVPRHAHLEIDVRDIDGDRRDTVVQSIIKSVKDNAKKRGLDYTVDIINQDPPAKCAKQVAPLQETAWTHDSFCSVNCKLKHMSLVMSHDRVP